MQKLINSNMEQYAIYLRKSRKDEEAEMQGAGETLARHEKIMLDLAKKMNIIIGKIYREVVSGDSISARPVIQELLLDVENGLWSGVLVIEVERLARGNTLDQGIVSNTFKYSSTKIITPMKTYDPNNEFDEEYFEFGLFMSRREYNTIKRRLHNGIISTVKEGKTVASQAPFGYERYKLKGKGYSLRIIDKDAEIIKMIFEMYTNGKNLGEIISKLNELNIAPPGTGKKWYKTTLQSILTNITYTGKIRYIDKQYLRKVVNGSLVQVKNPNPEEYLVNGLHSAIISEEMFEKAQKIYKEHQLADTRTKEDFELKNPLSTLVKCKVCGQTLKRVTNGTSSPARLGCRNYDISSSFLYLIEDKILQSLQILLNNYKLDLSSSNKDIEISSSIKNIDNQIVHLTKDLEKTSSQKSKLYDFLEQGIYDNNTFIERSNILANKICDINNKLSELSNLKEDYQTLQDRKENIIPNIENVIETYSHANIIEKNKLLKSCLEKVEYYKPKGSRKKEDFEIILYPKL